MTTQVLTRFIHALWLGSGAFLMLIAAPAAFRAAPNSTAAANVVGAMLGRWHYLAIAAPLVLLILDWRRARTHVLVVVFIALLFAAAQIGADMRIRSIRQSSDVPISSLSRQDPLRRQFGMMHGISSLLLLAQVLCAGVALAMDNDAYRGARPSAISLQESEPATESSAGATVDPSLRSGL
ncbi:MAG: hypothetical protein JJE51_11155 [Thermoanaerobaculia bacterium]|nr:hypothetical protein [Thermoanaerobaculia bacterium]